jgi:hypothetical protein
MKPSRRSLAMANIWDINISQPKVAVRLLNEIGYLKSIQSEQQLNSSIESTTFCDHEESILQKSLHKRRNAFGNIWRFRTYKSLS